MDKNPIAADHLERASKLNSTPSHATGLLRAARELAIDDSNELIALAYLAEAYQLRLNGVIETHMEHLRQHDFSTAAEWRSEAMAAADEALHDAQKALRIALVC